MLSQINSNLDQRSYNRIKKKSENINYTKVYQQAFKKITPAWDLRDNVAVNPFFGLRDWSFIRSMKYFQDMTGTDLTPSWSYFKTLLNEDRIKKADLKKALDYLKDTQPTSNVLKVDFNELINIKSKIDQPNEVKILSLIDFYDLQNNTGLKKEISTEVSKWLAAYYDEGQSAWAMPFKNKRLFTAWLQLIKFDKRYSNQIFKTDLDLNSLSRDPNQVVTLLSERLKFEFNLDDIQLENYYFRLLSSSMGWATFVQKHEFEAIRSGNTNYIDKHGGLLDLLAIRMVYDFVYLNKIKNKNFYKYNLDFIDNASLELEHKYIFLLASEYAERRKILAKMSFEKPNELSNKSDDKQNIVLAKHEKTTVPSVQKIKTKTPLAQMVFCIDVRSEVIRRNIELQNTDIQTIGFAGFFGVPMSYAPLNFKSSEQQCPVLLNSGFEFKDGGKNIEKVLGQRKKIIDFFKSFKQTRSNLNSCYTFVETMGLAYLFKGLRASFSKSLNLNFETFGMTAKDQKKIRPETKHLSLDQKVALGFGALKNMSLTANFAPLVVFVGHKGQSTNNPQASTLDCGACAGHSGLSNARVLASILNDEDVRSQIFKLYKVLVPESTYFASGVHNTTIDTIEIDCEFLKGTEQRAKIDFLNDRLKGPLIITAIIRAQKLDLISDLNLSANFDQKIIKGLNLRSTDWSEVRQEWALSGNTSFIAAKREITKAIDLEGRSFLHDYNYEEDTDLKVLELIMTAPLIVAHWINFQYYASTVDQKVFGSRNKVLHNVVGTIGLVEGGNSDLLLGLSEQSVYKNGIYAHEPIRLQAFIEAPVESLNVIIEEHLMVRELLDNDWIHLISIDPKTDTINLYKKGTWENINYLRTVQ